MFDYLKKIAISNRADDELLYEFVITEMESGVLSKGLWGKALADSNGDDAKAKSIYMKHRVQSIKDVFTAKKIAYNELTKPNLFEYIQEQIFPITNDYTNIVSSSENPVGEKYQLAEGEESIYNAVAKELENDIRKEGLWLKAIESTNGNESKTLALYIKYRAKTMKDEQKELRQAEAIERQRLEQELEEARINRANKGKSDLELMKEEKLEIFLKKNSLKLIESLPIKGYKKIEYLNPPLLSIFHSKLIYWSSSKNDWSL